MKKAIQPFWAVMCGNDNRDILEIGCILIHLLFIFAIEACCKGANLDINHDLYASGIRKIKSTIFMKWSCLFLRGKIGQLEKIRKRVLRIRQGAVVSKQDNRIKMRYVDNQYCIFFRYTTAIGCSIHCNSGN